MEKSWRNLDSKNYKEIELKIENYGASDLDSRIYEAIDLDA